MLELFKGAKLILETCARVKPGEKVLIIADDQLFPVELSRVMMDVAGSLGADAVLAVMSPREIVGHEPPPPVAAAMKSVNAVFIVTAKYGIAHTNARKEATAAGIRVYAVSQLPEDYFKRDITAADIERIKDCTERAAGLMSKARRAHVTAPGGTDITMGLEGRQALPLHPMWEVLGTPPDYAEAAISPVEGTAEGTVVVDIGVVRWEYLLREPIRLTVRSGRIIEVAGASEDAARFRRIVNTDENSSNIAELAIGTSHTIPRLLQGTRRDAGILGNVHIGVGRSNDIGGQTWSRIHSDVLIHRPTLELDGQAIVRDGALV